MFLKFLFLTFLISMSSTSLKSSDEVLVDYDVLNNIEVDYDALDDLGSKPVKKSDINLKKPSATKKQSAKKVSSPVKVYKKKEAKQEIVKAEPKKEEVKEIVEVKEEVKTQSIEVVKEVKEEVVTVPETLKEVTEIKEEVKEEIVEQVNSVEQAKVNPKYLVIYFNENGTILSENDSNKIKSLYSQYDQSSKIKVISYASGVKGNKSSAKRTSLSRALAVRSELISLGVKSSLIEVRALGQSINPEKSDCVEITIIK
ncbi:MAG: OmpA family protein [Alphaproteobacteria bacterium ADurb.Bin438]|nr:MAG: OmpA family protein [Alphaproteobacteria bacterium ADurb.Bin438]